MELLTDRKGRRNSVLRKIVGNMHFFHPTVVVTNVDEVWRHSEGKHKADVAHDKNQCDSPDLQHRTGTVKQLQ